MSGRGEYKLDFYFYGYKSAKRLTNKASEGM